MIKTAERKSKYKHKVVIDETTGHVVDVADWCEKTFGPGGRSRKLRWRRGWTDKDITFYFREGKDASMFLLKWS